MKKVFAIGEKIKQLTDTRKRKEILVTTTVIIVLVGSILQQPSFNSIFTHQSFKKRSKKLFQKGTKIPELDAARAIVEHIDIDELMMIHDQMISKILSNKVLRNGTIDGLVVAAIDGVELFSSYNKCCDDCLERTHKKSGEEKTEYFHRSVVCMTVGSDPHIILGEEMLHPRDGNQKDEGEPTGAKRLVENLYKKHNHFADVIVGDALYLQAPFIELVTSKNIDVVIRAKDTNRIILQDALGLVKREPCVKTFRENNVTVKVWDIKGFQMERVNKPLRFLQFEETRTIKKTAYKKINGVRKKIVNKTKETITVWVFTTLDVPPETVWRIIHKRWDIENNGFHQLKTYYHAKHCFDHNATENIFLLNIIAFNIRELYLYRRRRNFRMSKQTRVDITKEWLDDLLLHTFQEYFNIDSG